MVAKKVIKRKPRKNKTKSLKIQDLSLSDLYALYTFVSNDGNNRGFGVATPDARKVVREKQREIEKELYLRAYGYNPFEKYKVIFEGMKPEDVDLDRVVIAKGEIEEPKDEEPQRFIVVKNNVKEG